MTVKELIEKLKEFQEDTEVVVWDEYAPYDYPVLFLEMCRNKEKLVIY